MTSILLIGETLGQEEARLGQPFVGPSGGFLLRLLNDSGIIEFDPTDQMLMNQYYKTRNPRYNAKIWERHSDIQRTNVFNVHPEGNDLSTLCGPKFLGIDDYPALVKSKYVSKQYLPELDRLACELLSLNPNLVICLGGTPLWALYGRTGIKKFRGSTFLSTHCAADFKCLATYHPSYLFKQPKDRAIVLADFAKALRESTTPTITRPEREIWIEPSLEDIAEFIQEISRRGPGHVLSVDIETTGTRVTCIGMGYSDVAIVIPFDDSRRKGRSYWETDSLERLCWQQIVGVLQDGSIPKLFQNGLYDIAFLYRSLGIKVMGASEDTMLAHHALQPEMIKDLGFLGSVYTDEGAWKHLGKRAKTIKGDN